MEAQQVKSVIERALVSFTGQTTSAGNIGGTTLVCSTLTAHPDYDGQTVLIRSGAYAGQSGDISGTTVAGTVTVGDAFDGQIGSGVSFMILTGIPVTTEVAALATSVALIPQSGGSTTWNATALAAINTQVDTALDTAIPGTPTADSINERVKTLDTDVTALLADIGDFSARVNLASLLLALGIPDVAAKSLYTCLVTDRLDVAGHGLEALDTELGLIPQSGGSTTWNSTALGSINAEVDTALNTAIPGTNAANSINDILLDQLQPRLPGSGTLSILTAANINTEVDSALDTAIPGSPTADSINERIKTLDDAYTATRGPYLDELAAANLPADIDSVLALVDSAEAAGPFSYLDAGGEQDVVEDTAVTRRKINIEFSNANMTLTGDFIIYRKTDGSTYDVWATINATVAAGDDRCWDAEFVTNQAWKLTYEETGGDEGAARAIPFNVITQVIE